MQPELHIGPVTLQTFGIMFALGFVVAGVVVRRRLIELGRPADWAYEIILAGLVGGVVGARIWFIVQHWSQVSSDPLGAIFSGEGLVWYGGFIGGVVFVVSWAAWRRFVTWHLVDVTALGIAVGYAVGRVGCQISGDGDYGKASNLPWAMSYPDGAVPIDQTVQPTPVYETLAMGVIVWALWRWRDALRPGSLFAVYLILAGLERFLVEFVRRNTEVFLGLTTAQLVSLGVIVVGLIWIAVRGLRPPEGDRRPGKSPRERRSKVVSAAR